MNQNELPEQQEPADGIYTVCSFVPRPREINAIYFCGKVPKLIRSIHAIGSKAFEHITTIRRDSGHPTRVIVHTLSYDIVLYPGYWLYWEESGGLISALPSVLFHERYERKQL